MRRGTEFAREIEEAGRNLAVAPQARRVADVAPVSAGVLRDDEELLYARLHELFGFAQHLAGGARGETSAKFGDDAERAAVVAALGDLQIGVVARRELDALLGDQVEERVVRRGRRVVHRSHHALVGLRAGDGGDVGVDVADRVRLGPHAAGDDDAAVLGHRRADRRQRFRFGAVEEAAGVDDDGVGAGVGFRQFVAFGAQAREDALAVDERLGAAERDEGDARRGARGGVGVGHARPLATRRRLRQGAGGWRGGSAFPGGRRLCAPPHPVEPPEAASRRTGKGRRRRASSQAG